jgi:hypothetical protein
LADGDAIVVRQDEVRWDRDRERLRARLPADRGESGEEWSDVLEDPTAGEELAAAQDVPPTCVKPPGPSLG